MSVKQKMTIFQQLIISISIPVLSALALLTGLNYLDSQSKALVYTSEKNDLIANNITQVLDLQEEILQLIDKEQGRRMRLLSNNLVNQTFKDTKHIATAKLDVLRKRLDMSPNFEDIYIIDDQGTIINTTFEKDQGLNLFNFGTDHKNFLLKILEGNRFHDEKIAIENATKRLKKYTYQPTVDGKYIIELGFYSPKADAFIDIIKKKINELSKVANSVADVELYIGAEIPFSLNKGVKVSRDEDSTLYCTFQTQRDTSINLEKNDRYLSYQYLYLKNSQASDLYKGSVIRIAYDLTREREMLRKESAKALAISLGMLLIVSLLIYRTTQVVTNPIKNLVAKVSDIRSGQMGIRVQEEGINEVVLLTKHFNNMLDEIQSFIDTLEQKVADRTEEIKNQNEEIAQQRDFLVRQNQRLEIANQEIATKQRDIQASINYAKRLQLSLLNSESEFKTHFPDSFILNQPKSIVSGDFYWLKAKGDKIFVAAVDCTGHGVPGAFMSIIANNLLEAAVDQEGADTPAVILDSLNKGIMRALNTHSDQRDIADGMDIALCAVNRTTNEIEFAGAYNPLCYVTDGTMQLIKGDRLPIGNTPRKKQDPYTNHKLPTKPGDVFYLFSDGYTDQFGGDTWKRLGAKQFRQLLLDMSDKPMNQQLQILQDTSQKWCWSTEEQLDDILVLGIRL